VHALPLPLLGLGLGLLLDRALLGRDAGALHQDLVALDPHRLDLRLGGGLHLFDADLGLGFHELRLGALLRVVLDQVRHRLLLEDGELLARGLAVPPQQGRLGHAPRRRLRVDRVVLEDTPLEVVQVQRALLGLLGRFSRAQDEGTGRLRGLRRIGVQGSVQPLVAHGVLAEQRHGLVVHGLRNLGLVQAQLGEEAVAREVREGRGTLPLSCVHLFLHVDDPILRRFDVL